MSASTSAIHFEIMRWQERLRVPAECQLAASALNATYDCIHLCMFESPVTNMAMIQHTCHTVHNQVCRSLLCLQVSGACEVEKELALSKATSAQVSSSHLGGFAFPKTCHSCLVTRNSCCCLQAYMPWRCAVCMHEVSSCGERQHC